MYIFERNKYFLAWAMPCNLGLVILGAEKQNFCLLISRFAQGIPTIIEHHIRDQVSSE